MYTYLCYSHVKCSCSVLKAFCTCELKWGLQVLDAVAVALQLQLHQLHGQSGASRIQTNLKQIWSHLKKHIWSIWQFWLCISLTLPLTLHHTTINHKDPTIPRLKRSAWTWRWVFTSSAKKCLETPESQSCPSLAIEIMHHASSCVMSHLIRQTGTASPHACSSAREPTFHVCIITGREHAFLDDTAEKEWIRLWHT